MRVRLAVDTLDERIAAALHDVVEDSPWTLDQLRDVGFSPQVVAAVDALTRRDDEDYDAFIARAKRDPIARRVKCADLLDNRTTNRSWLLRGTCPATTRHRCEGQKCRHARTCSA